MALSLTLAEKAEALERTALELEAMVSIFGHDFTGEDQADLDGEELFVVTTPDALECAQTIIDSPNEADVDIPQITVETFIRASKDNPYISGGGVRLRISLPHGYPSICCAKVSVLPAPIPRDKFDELSTKLQCRSKELVGCEAMMEIINECRDVLEGWENDKQSCHQISEEGDIDEDKGIHDTTISRRWIWVHHITKPNRLKQIVAEAQSLNLGGFLKGGYPGVVVAEGDTKSCDEFVTWIKGNKSRPGGFGRNWGHHVRGEATIDKRQLPGSFEELEDDMGRLGSLCKEFGVEDEFREFILQHK